MHHKRGRPKDRRAGCLLCKPHKANRAKGTAKAQTRQERIGRDKQKQQIDDLENG
jgi:hypothetical protein